MPKVNVICSADIYIGYIDGMQNARNVPVSDTGCKPGVPWSVILSCVLQLKPASNYWPITCL